MLDKRVNKKYKERIVEIAKEIYKQKVIEAKHNNKDFKEYPHLFLLGAVMDSQILADKAWKIPYKIAEELGGKDFPLFCSKDLNWYINIFKSKKLHRFNVEMSKAFYLAIEKIKNDYNGNAANIWNDNPSMAELILRLLEFRKIGIKIATMVANILFRECNVKLQDTCILDISPDVHVKRAMYRLGLLPTIKNVNIKNIEQYVVICAAKSIYPEFPGVLDPVFWEIGYNKTCTNDGCNSSENKKCPFADFCIKQM